mgnify:CR=1 FL=1
MKHICSMACLLLMLVTSAAAAGDEEGIGFALAGKIRPRHAKEIASSNWSVGAETMDRDYTVYENWKAWLGPLGAKKARIQGGWAKTEQQQGVYDWAWLDTVVFDMPKQGVKPWMCLSYGNLLYEGGGGTNLHGNVPTSAAGLAAWQAWVKATVTRYKDVIDEWEIWNEPNYKVAAPDYARLLILTAETIKAVQPKGTVIAFALGSRVNYKYADKVLAIVQQQNKLHLIDQISHHRHQQNPDITDPEIELAKVVQKYEARIVIRQGEAGCPSALGKTRAMANYPWTELIQAKHVLRRLLGDLGRDKPSSCFGIVDMKYPDEMNRKGLLLARDDMTVQRPKPAYHAVQHLTAIFDDRLARIKDFRHETAPAELPLSVYGYRHQPSERTIVTVWFNDQVPSNDNAKRPVDFVLHGASFAEPLYVDLRTGRAYAIPAANWQQQGDAVRFSRIPCYDAPVLIADRAALPLE